MTFELVEDDRITPIALIPLGDQTLELLGGATEPGSGGTRIEEVVVSVPLEADAEVAVELAAGIVLRCLPGTSKGIRRVSILSPDVGTDRRLLAEILADGDPADGDPADGTGTGNGGGAEPLHSGGAEIVLREGAAEQGAPAGETPLHAEGWHRLSFGCDDLPRSHDRLLGAGLLEVLAPFRVMPGLQESMLRTPSGLLVQLTQEQLWKMLPAMVGPWIAAKVSRRKMRFRVQPLE